MLLLACFRIIRVDALSEGLFKYIDDIKKCLIPNFLHLKHFRHLFRSPEQTCSAHPVSFLHSVYTIVIFFLFSKAIMKDGDALLKGPPAVVVAVCLCVVFMTTESLRAIKGDPVYKWPVTAESVQCQVRMLWFVCSHVKTTWTHRKHFYFWIHGLAVQHLAVVYCHHHDPVCLVFLIFFV